MNPCSDFSWLRKPSDAPGHKTVVVHSCPFVLFFYCICFCSCFRICFCILDWFLYFVLVFVFFCIWIFLFEFVFVFVFVFLVVFVVVRIIYVFVFAFGFAFAVVVVVVVLVVVVVTFVVTFFGIETKWIMLSSSVCLWFPPCFNWCSISTQTHQLDPSQNRALDHWPTTTKLAKWQFPLCSAVSKIAEKLLDFGPSSAISFRGRFVGVRFSDFGLIQNRFGRYLINFLRLLSIAAHMSTCGSKAVPRAIMQLESTVGEGCWSRGGID